MNLLRLILVKHPKGDPLTPGWYPCHQTRQYSGTPILKALRMPMTILSNVFEIYTNIIILAFELKLIMSWFWKKPRVFILLATTSVPCLTCLITSSTKQCYEIVTKLRAQYNLKIDPCKPFVQSLENKSGVWICGICSALDWVAAKMIHTSFLQRKYTNIVLF